MKTVAQSIVLAVVVILAGISTVLSSDPSGASLSAAKSPITIGYVCSCTGVVASGAVAGPPAFQAWVKATNAAGVINGHPVSVIVKDDAESSQTGVADPACAQ